MEGRVNIFRFEHSVCKGSILNKFKFLNKFEFENHKIMSDYRYP